MDAEFLSFTSLLSLQGATAAVVIVTNTLGSVIGKPADPYRKWIALALSLLLGLLGVTQVEDPTWREWLVATLNGFLIAAAALGINDTTVSVVNGAARRRGRIIVSWLG